MVKAVIFDFDGVIHDTFEFHRSKIEEYSGIALSEQEYRDMHNGNFHSNSDHKTKDIDWFGYRDHVRDEYVCLKIRQEIREILLQLESRYDLFIITSASSKNIIDYLDNNRVVHVFQEILGFEEYASKVEKFNHILDKYELLPENCLFVSDTLGDILEAHDVGVKTIAVTFGYHDKEVLKKGNPYKIISNIEELAFLLSKTCA